MTLYFSDIPKTVPVRNSPLFLPLELRGLTVENRIMVSPMAQFSAVDGNMTDWHLVHLGSLSMSGVGLLCFEMTDVEPIGRISLGCAGLYSDANEAALARVVGFCREHGRAKLALQLAHAGRRGSKRMRSEGHRVLLPADGGWEPVAPSAIALDEHSPVPRALSRDEIKALVEKFAAATRRAERIGFDALELHGAHGYLIHGFLSPLSNRRTDEYGGSLENRMRFPLEVFAAMRAAWPAGKPLGVRVSCTEWRPDGWDIEDTVAFAIELKRLGCDWIDCSSGGGHRNLAVPFAPGFQVPFAERVRKEVNIPTVAVGYITEPHMAEKIVAEGKADMVALGCGMMWNPRWGWHAANALGADLPLPPQYWRARPVF